MIEFSSQCCLFHLPRIFFQCIRGILLNCATLTWLYTYRYSENVQTVDPRVVCDVRGCRLLEHRCEYSAADMDVLLVQLDGRFSMRRPLQRSDRRQLADVHRKPLHQDILERRRLVEMQMFMLQLHYWNARTNYELRSGDHFRLSKTNKSSHNKSRQSSQIALIEMALRSLQRVNTICKQQISLKLTRWWPTFEFRKGEMVTRSNF